MSGTAQVSIICVSINSLPADSNTSRKSFDTVEQADFQIYILRFPSAKHSDEPLKAGIVEAFAEHDSRFQGFIGMFCRGEPEYIYLKIRRPPTYKIFPPPVGNPPHFC